MVVQSFTTTDMATRTFTLGLIQDAVRRLRMVEANRKATLVLVFAPFGMEAMGGKADAQLISKMSREIQAAKRYFAMKNYEKAETAARNALRLA